MALDEGHACIADVSALTVRRLKRNLPQKPQIQTKHKLFTNNTDLWNPVLLMIAMDQAKPLEKLLLTRTTTHLHLPALCSKPYSADDQYKKLFTPHNIATAGKL